MTPKTKIVMMSVVTGLVTCYPLFRKQVYLTLVSAFSDERVLSWRRYVPVTTSGSDIWWFLCIAQWQRTLPMMTEIVVVSSVMALGWGSSFLLIMMWTVLTSPIRTFAFMVVSVRSTTTAVSALHPLRLQLRFLLPGPVETPVKVTIIMLAVTLENERMVLVITVLSWFRTFVVSPTLVSRRPIVKLTKAIWHTPPPWTLVLLDTMYAPMITNKNSETHGNIRLVTVPLVGPFYFQVCFVWLVLFDIMG